MARLRGLGQVPVPVLVLVLALVLVLVPVLVLGRVLGMVMALVLALVLAMEVNRIDSDYLEGVMELERVLDPQNPLNRLFFSLP